MGGDRRKPGITRPGRKGARTSGKLCGVTEIFLEDVQHPAEAQGEMMLLHILVLVQEVEEGRMLPGVEGTGREIGLHRIVGIVGDQGNVGRIGLIQRKTCLEIAAQALAEDLGGPELGEGV